ncbi:bifunctional D-glycero-beta-D-manno-heptose-7-phosphate kinase/D-glycero-beta-D-manno-heptose 1-phosphate adenylyltransferase HldE [Simiduia sp. 21SJ11W-1]|uniref:bifunctional D-glycero-beta-D-manno-heptose-7-phosphate kinase/D-glycero-beta-D-manno-heptose 1-phosphate adenylyltransferase HldE n=1 Tax=Simiduia sp. 21SJ11W-1 TaxID=2909669 RepID=UPI00209D0356|nr:bifunctional D-glycero-beta-D-manno-heptose-7-phosphate kinase/D-glycero-beta-D-manno-heptose 1-phosphate adenylyltransferase HldE [Simiduia sp. 21SJ11W-1]UTA48142.1 bifunctional D-glycero-beta-D-manno-heptose-7-phosphate kinase/D-glycero-beta-D-manno-heptose 1-phosphate adenylyltransferase HldE [Simiduia sp. 21SJ11W-1]
MLLNMPQFTQSQVLVIGDVMLDRYWHGGTSRISPEAPVPVVKVDQVEDRPGGAGNVALNIAALGAGCALVGIVGNDEAGDALKTRLSAANVHTDFQVVEGKPTITKLRVLSRHQQLLRMDFEEPYAPQDSSEFAAKAEALIAHMGAVILSDYAKGSLAEVQTLIALANKHQVPVLVDPKGSDFSRYQHATLMTPNLHEFETVVGKCETESQLVEKGLALLEQLGLQALLITRGEHGMTLLRKGKAELHLPARAREVYDVTGAGDTVISVLAASLAAGEELPQAVGLANLAAGIVVGKLGTATISAPELRRAVKLEQGSERGVLIEEQLLMAIEEARAAGERIVFTNGCFDIIHAGHVGYLEDTRALGDRLIVAINSDASVKRLKGAGRPINPVDRRMAVLAGLEAVDWVTFYDDDTPERLLKLIKPDVLVKGGDYTEDQVVGHEIVKAYGGTVKVLSFFENVSTTAIVEKIQRDHERKK